MTWAIHSVTEISYCKIALWEELFGDVPHQKSFLDSPLRRAP
jgi:hypothetical protein